VDARWLDEFCAGAAVACDPAGGTEGSVHWRSEEVLDHARGYRSGLPAGLHLGCGSTVAMRSRSRAGVVEARGTQAIAVVCHAPMEVRTELLAGRYLSAGLSMPLGSPVVEPFLHEFRFGDRESMQALPVPAAIVARLTAPIDPWFDGPARRLAAEARGLELAATLVAAFCGTPQAKDSPGRQRQRRLAFAAREYLDARLATPPTLAEIAAAVGTNPRALNVTFRAVFGRSVGAWLAGRRLDVAADLLREGHSSKSVAYQLGYSPAHFSAAFRQRFGVQPRHFCGGVVIRR
jgi:AraC-like DNA-binding protein